MQNPLEITFHETKQNPKIEGLIVEKFEKIKQLAPDVTKFHVILEKQSKHHKTANAACVKLDLKIPHFKDIILHEPCNEDEASLTKAVIKVLKEGGVLLREQIKYRLDQHRAPRQEKYEIPVGADTEEDE